MGCDLWLRGQLPDLEKQQQVIRFVSRLLGPDSSIVIKPIPDKTFATGFDHMSATTPSHLWVNYDESRSFNYAGVMPRFGNENFGYGHYVFDNSREGLLVSLIRLPDCFGIPTWEEVARPIFKCKCVEVRDGSYIRFPGERPAYVAAFIKLRFWPELLATDDYQIVDRMLFRVKRFNLESMFRDGKASFEECMKNYQQELAWEIEDGENDDDEFYDSMETRDTTTHNGFSRLLDSPRKSFMDEWQLRITELQNHGIDPWTGEKTDPAQKAGVTEDENECSTAGEETIGDSTDPPPDSD